MVALVLMLFAGCAVSAARPLHATSRLTLANSSADGVARVDGLMHGVFALIRSTEANMATAPYTGLP